MKARRELFEEAEPPTGGPRVAGEPSWPGAVASAPRALRLRGGPPEPRAEDAQSFFDAAAEDYEAQHYGPGVRSLMSVRLERILAVVDRLGLPPGSLAVEAGCGPGHITAALAARGLRAVAFDTSPAMLRRARRRLEAGAGARAYGLQLATAERMPYRDASVDLVCSAGVLEYLPRDGEMLREVHRILRPGGRALLAVTNFWSPAGWLDFAVEAAKRRPWVIRAVGSLHPRHPVRPRHFAVRRHRPAAFRASLARAGLGFERGEYFYLLPWPHPLDRLLPRATARLNRRLEPASRSAFGPLAEGYLALARRPG